MNPEPQRDHQPICCALPDWRPAQGALQLGRNTVRYQPEPWPQLKRHMQCAVGGDHTVEKAKASCRGPIKPLEFIVRLLKPVVLPRWMWLNVLPDTKRSECYNAQTWSSTQTRHEDQKLWCHAGNAQTQCGTVWWTTGLNGTEKRVTETGRDGEAGQLAQINFEKQ